MSDLPQRTVIALVILVLANVAWPNDFFVAQKAPAASDISPGTEALPFKTIQAAIEKVQAGDTIWVKEGVYEEALEPKSSGRADTPITLSAWKDTVVLLAVLRR
jgi:pectin methylesterase-like acyl-CoA thioesterase